MISGVRSDLMVKLHETWFAAEIAALLAIVIATCLSAALLSFPDLHQMRRFALAPAIIFILFALVMYFSWHAHAQCRMHSEHHTACDIAGGVDLLCNAQIRQHPSILGGKHRAAFGVQHRGLVVEAL